MDGLPEFNQSNRETPNLNQQLPLQLRLGARSFVELLEEYYRFLNDKDNPTRVIQRIVDEHDLDKVVDDLYLDKIKYEIARAIPTSPYVQKAFLLKRIIDSYGIRGNEESVRYFFRIFFNEDVTIYNPWEQVLIPSQGDWITQQRARILLYTGNETLLSNNTLVQYDNQGRLRASIDIEQAEKRITRDKFYFDVVLREDTIEGAFDDNLPVQTIDGQCRGRFLRSLTGIDIVDGGVGYSIGDRLYLGGKENVTFQALVSRVDSQGKILQANIQNYGTSSSVDYFSNIENDPEMIPNLSDVYLNGYLFEEEGEYYLHTRVDQYPDQPDIDDSHVFPISTLTPTEELRRHLGLIVDITGNISTEGINIARIHDRNGSILIHDFVYYNEEDVKSEDVILNFDNDPRYEIEYDAYGFPYVVYDIAIQSSKVIDLDAYGDPIGLPEFALTFGSVFQTDGFYANEKGRPSGFSVLQDSFYYQVFSYEINSTLPINEWKSQLEELIHPGGFKVFGRINSADEGIVAQDPEGDIVLDPDFTPPNITIYAGSDLTSSVNVVAQNYNYDDPGEYFDAYGDPIELGLVTASFPYPGYLGELYFAEDYTVTTEFEYDLVYDPFTPTYMEDVVQLDGTDNSNIALHGGGKVNSWATTIPTGGSELVFSNSNENHSPSLGDINGNQSLVFNVRDDDPIRSEYLQSPTNPFGAGGTTTNQYAFFMVLEVNTLPALGTPGYFPLLADVPAGMYLQLRDNGSLFFKGNANTPEQVGTPVGTIVAGNQYIISGHFDLNTSNIEIFVNGVSVGTNTPTIGYAIPTNPFRIEGNSNAGEENEMGEILFLPEQAIGESYREAIEGYLAWKWGMVGLLPFDHPHKIFAPRVDLFFNGSSQDAEYHNVQGSGWDASAHPLYPGVQPISDWHNMGPDPSTYAGGRDYWQNGPWYLYWSNGTQEMIDGGEGFPNPHPFGGVWHMGLSLGKYWLSTDLSLGFNISPTVAYFNVLLFDNTLTPDAAFASLNIANLWNTVAGEFAVGRDPLGGDQQEHDLIFTVGIGIGLGLAFQNNEYDPNTVDVLTLEGIPYSGNGYFRRDESEVWEYLEIP
jgi:hypothetical protein